jgi:hypothetical protein
VQTVPNGKNGKSPDSSTLYKSQDNSPQNSLSELSLEPIARLTKDLAIAAATLSPREARYLVDAYYVMQRNRITSSNQVRSLSEDEEPHSVLSWMFAQDEALENQIRRALDKWTDSQHMGRWAKAITGIGPVISAGLLAHVEWKKGEKRPFNSSLKCLCAFKLGESFVKVQNNENDVYGKIYAARKREETARNETGEFSAQASAILSKRNIGKNTEA